MVSWIFIGLVATILLTPGPTNTLLASSGLQLGARKSLKLIPAEMLGYFIAITIWGSLVGEMAKAMAGFVSLMKLMSAIYIIFLAIKLWKSADSEIVQNKSIITVKELLVTTLLNPKALLFASGIFPAESFLRLESYLGHMVTFLLLIVPISLFWIVLGFALSNNKLRFLTQSRLQKFASVILTIFTIPLSYSAIVNF